MKCKDRKMGGIGFLTWLLLAQDSVLCQFVTYGCLIKMLVLIKKGFVFME